MKNWYGLLAGLLYTVPYSFFGLVAGKISDNVNRKLFLGIVIALSGLTMGISGLATSFTIFSVMRIFSGMLNAASNPLSFSLITDYFPPEKRATANSLIQAGNYVGGGLSSFTIILISMYGWRASYGVMAAVAGVVGLATATLIREPERGRYIDEATKRKEAQKKA